MSTCCEFFNLARSSYYRQPAEKAPDDELRSAIKAIAGQFPTYGSRRITVQLALPPYLMRVGRNRVRQLMAEMNLLRKPKRSRSPTHGEPGQGTYSNLVKGVKAERPEHIWVADITYIRLRRGQAFLAIVMDVFTRVIRGWRLSRSAGDGLTIGALQMAMREQGAPAIHHSDRGGQYASKRYVAILEGAGTQISMAAAGKPSENGFAERVIRTIKEEEVYLSDYETLEEARAQLGHFIDEVYRHKRIHSALGYQTPAGSEAEWRANTP